MQAAIISYIDDFKLMMILSLAELVGRKLNLPPDPPATP
jgi:hypothetical protein